jgi:D-alanyl-lipoteichoic acid acyltransferase DltB (MBOAT superfamily)
MIPGKWRLAFLLAASYFFYMSWKPEYLILILIATVSAYYLGQKIAAQRHPGRRKALLAVSLCVNLGMLFGFKYFNFFSAQTDVLFRRCGMSWDIPVLNVLLPVGISFFTFQAVGYVIDVYRGDVEPERRPGIFALFISFFPQLVAGPIERSRNLLPQFLRKTGPDPARFTDGLRLMLWGYFKKIAVADNLSPFVDKIYAAPQDFTGLQLIVATYFFTLQIYCDFSGYTDIARGAARIMGYDLMPNFRMPYFAASMEDFWKRWHISLSTWFRDYVYIPLGGNRRGDRRRFLNLAAVFLLSGLWHGANWTFVAWGALHCAYIMCSLWARAAVRRFHGLALPRIPAGPGRLVKIFITFHLTAFAWIFFRAGSMSDALYIVTHLGSNLGGSADILLRYGPVALIKSVFSFGAGVETINALAAILSAGILIAVEAAMAKFHAKNLLDNAPGYARWAAYYAVVFWIIVFGSFGDKSFIYFQF